MTNDATTEASDARDRVIRAIHAYADWLAAHPEVPAPTRIQGYHHCVLRAGTEPVLAEWAAANQLTIRPGNSGATYATLVVAADDVQGVEIEHTVFEYPPAPKPRFP